MKQDIRYLLGAVADGDMKAALSWAEMIVDADHTDANKSFCNAIRNRIKEKKTAAKLVELPENVKGILIAEDPNVTFNPNRYFLSEREKCLADRIFMLRSASELLKKAHVSYLNASIFYGESGTGKTLFGRYLAQRAGLPFIYINLTNVISSCLGDTSRNIGKAFEFAGTSPCVFMLDELDAIGCVRSDAKAAGAEREMSRVTIAVIQAMDRMSPDTMLLAATNRPDSIDDAIMRRFTLKHRFEVFTSEETREMLTRQLDDIKAVDAFPVNVDTDAFSIYCKSAPKQSDAAADLVFALAASVLTGAPVVMERNRR